MTTLDIYETSAFWLTVQELVVDNPAFEPLQSRLQGNVITRLGLRTVKRYCAELRNHYIPFFSSLTTPESVNAFPVESSIAVLYVQFRFEKTDAKTTAASALRALLWVQRVMAYKAWPAEETQLLRDLVDKTRRARASPVKRAAAWPIGFISTLFAWARAPTATLLHKRLAALVAILLGACKRKGDALPIARYDIFCFDACIVLFFAQTKTDTYRDGSYGVIARNLDAGDDCFCTVIEDYLRVAGILDMSEDHPAASTPIFRATQYHVLGTRLVPGVGAGTPHISSSTMDKQLKDAQISLGMTPTLKYHGCRSLSLSHGLRTESVELMMRHGGWTSSAYLSYADPDIQHGDDRFQPSLLLSQAVSDKAPVVPLPNNMVPAPGDPDQDAVISAYDAARRAATDYRLTR